MEQALSQTLGNYLSMEYGVLQRLQCNIHTSSGTHMAQKPHHHDFYQIYFVVSGRLIHHTRSEAAAILGGDCFIVPPFTLHHIEVTEDTPVFYSFSFYQTFLPEYVCNNPEISKLLSVLQHGTALTKLTLSDQLLYEMETAMALALREFDAKCPAWDCVVQSALSTILVLLSRAYFALQPNLQISRPEILKVLEYVNTHFSEHLSAAELANAAYLSTSSFYRVFRALTGLTFQQYLTQLRIRHACLLLRQTGEPLAKICTQCGYRDYSTFVRAFEKQIHISPFRYRQQANADRQQAPARTGPLTD